LRRFTLACAGLLACCASATGAPQAVAGQKANNAVAVPSLAQVSEDTAVLRENAQARQAAIAWLSQQVYAYQRATWRWENLMGVPRTPTEGRVLAEMRVEHVKRAVTLWKRRAAVAHRRAQRPPHLNQFLCIHHYEGSWTDGGGPYYGGLQMDLGFQAAYGRSLLRAKGTADHWTPLEQIWVAEKAAKSRGFYPWPNTARFCGLI
jgi:hypothetical protein